MKKNLGTVDRIVRVLIFATISVLFLLGKIEGVLGYVLLIVSTVLLITAFINFCPIYRVFNISSRKKESKL